MEEQEKTSENKDEEEFFTDEGGVKRYKKTGQIAPGFTANPNGRPKGSLSITAMVKSALMEIPEGQKISYAEAFVRSILKKAIQEGDVQMQKSVWAYIDGQPKQSIEVDDLRKDETKEKLDNLIKEMKDEKQ